MDRTPMDELKSAVDDLKGVKPADIAAMLKRRKILGRPGTTGRCPLALLMAGAHGGKFIVGQKMVMRVTKGGKGAEKVKTPPNLAAFVRMFDAGKFPELIQVPPRCQKFYERVDKRPSGPNSKRGVANKHKRGAERLHLSKDVQRFSGAET